MHNIVLIGMKGAGKSTLAKVIVRKFKRRLIQTDSEVSRLYQEQQGVSLTNQEIVRHQGEPFFRLLETEVLQQLVDQKTDNAIVDCGGGIVLSEKNRPLLQQLGHVVWIHLDMSMNLQRLLQNGIPSFFPAGSPPEETFQHIWEERLPLYRNVATHILEIRHENSSQILEKFLALHLL